MSAQRKLDGRVHSAEDKGHAQYMPGAAAACASAEPLTAAFPPMCVPPRERTKAQRSGCCWEKRPGVVQRRVQVS